jgi:hypothetical protein
VATGRSQREYRSSAMSPMGEGALLAAQKPGYGRDARRFELRTLRPRCWLDNEVARRPRPYCFRECFREIRSRWSPEACPTDIECNIPKHTGGGRWVLIYPQTGMHPRRGQLAPLLPARKDFGPLPVGHIWATTSHQQPAKGL